MVHSCRTYCDSHVVVCFLERGGAPANGCFLFFVSYKEIVEPYFKYVNKSEVCYSEFAYENKTCIFSNKICECPNKEE